MESCVATVENHDCGGGYVGLDVIILYRAIYTQTYTVYTCNWRKWINSMDHTNANVSVLMLNYRDV